VLLGEAYSTILESIELTIDRYNFNIVYSHCYFYFKFYKSVKYRRKFREIFSENTFSFANIFFLLVYNISCLAKFHDIKILTKIKKHLNST